MSLKPNKKNDLQLFILIEACIHNNSYIFIGHAKQRLRERRVTDLEVLDLLENKKGRKRKRNKSKDKYEQGYEDWNYCIEGYDLDEQRIRVIISFNDKYMLIITVVRPAKEEH